MKISEIINLTAASKVITFLKEAPVTDAFSVAELSVKLHIPESTIKSSRVLKQYAFEYNGRTYYARAEVREKFAVESAIQEQILNES